MDNLLEMAGRKGDREETLFSRSRRFFAQTNVRQALWDLAAVTPRLRKVQELTRKKAHKKLAVHSLRAAHRLPTPSSRRGGIGVPEVESKKAVCFNPRVWFAASGTSNFRTHSVVCTPLSEDALRFSDANPDLVVLDSTSQLDICSGKPALKMLLHVVGRGLPIMASTDWPRTGSTLKDVPVLWHKAAPLTVRREIRLGPDLAKHRHTSALWKRICEMPGSKWKLLPSSDTKTKGVTLLADTDGAIQFLRSSRRLAMPRGISGRYSPRHGGGREGNPEAVA